MSVAFKVVTPPTTEPITLADAKAFLRVDFSDEDALIQTLITRARSYAEGVCHRAIATQTFQTLYTIDRPNGGELYGTIQEGPNWYQYQEQLGANPFGAAMFYFDLPMAAPIQSDQPFTVQTRTTVWDNWVPFTGLYTIDDVQEPCRVYFQVPVTANQWQFQYTAGYTATRPIPPELLQPIEALVTYWYENRDDPQPPAGITNALLARRVDWV